MRSSWRILLKEVAAFGAVGIVSLFIDLGIYNALFQYGSLKAKCVSTVVATTFAYFGNRHLSFSHRARTSIGRETSFFFAHQPDHPRRVRTRPRGVRLPAGVQLRTDW